MFAKCPCRAESLVKDVELQGYQPAPCATHVTDQIGSSGSCWQHSGEPSSPDLSQGG